MPRIQRSPGSRHRLGRRLRDLVLALDRAARRLDVVEQLVQLGVGEADQVQVELELVQRLELGAQQLLVPAGVLGDAVVGDHQRPALRVGEVVEDDRRDLRHPEPLRRQEPAVSGDDDAVAADQDRVGEPELGDRGGDLRDLLVGVGPGVPLVGAELGGRRGCSIFIRRAHTRSCRRRRRPSRRRGRTADRRGW